MTSTVGTDAFKAPEFYQRDQQRKIHYHRNVDIYALGLTYLAMVQENKSLVPQIETPGQDSELHEPIGRLIAERIKYDKEPLAIFPKSAVKDGKHIRSLIAKMTCHVPIERIAASGVIRNLKEIQRYGCELVCSVVTESSHENKVNNFYYKKVLLRERKRHTDRGVSSTSSVVLPGGGYPLPGVPPCWGGPPCQGGPAMGYPCWTDRQMDRHVSKHNLPSYYVGGR